MSNRDPLEEAMRPLRPLLETFTEIMTPFVEIAVHNIANGQIVEIFHNISQRREGEVVSLREFKRESAPHYRRNWDGRPLKCSSVPLRNEKGEVVGLISVSVDASLFQEAHRLLGAFLKLPPSEGATAELGGEDCKQQVARLMEEYVQEKKISPTHLSRSQKRDAVLMLYRNGVFNFKNAVPEVAGQLHLSRATIYNYLKGE